MTALRSGSLRTRVTVVAVAVLALALIAMVAITSALFDAASRRAVESVLTDRVTTARQVARTAATPEAFLRRVDGRSVRSPDPGGRNTAGATSATRRHRGVANG